VCSFKVDLHVSLGKAREKWSVRPDPRYARNLLAQNLVPLAHMPHKQDDDAVIHFIYT
jgi:hypothetical protein